jgi:penicillin amidase
MRNAIVKRADAMTLKPRQKETLDMMAAWDGRYNRESAGAVAFEAAISAFLPLAFTQTEIDALDAAGSPYTRLSLDVPTVEAVKFATAIAAGLDTGAIAAAAYPTWGDMHRMGVQGYFAAIPVIGSRYNFGDVPASGTAESVLKTDHPMTAERHLTRYGAQARHVSDLSNPDANWFVLLGGNDGWYQSANFRDQLQPFMDGKFFSVPLQIETVRATFPIKTKLKASTRPAS